MGERAIAASNINLSFDGVQVLQDVEFHVDPGEVHAVAGTNGAGKSSLMKILNGVYTRDSGDISVFGRSVDYSGAEGALKSGIAMVFQDLSLIPSLTVAENIVLHSHPFRIGPFIDDKKGAARTTELLELVGVETRIGPSDRVEELSAGERQVVEIAKALAHDPRILILDEPTASLSTSEIEMLFQVIAALKSRGIAVIYITHYLGDIFRVCDSLTLLRDGRVVFRKATDEIGMQELVDAMTDGGAGPVLTARRGIDRSGVPLLEVESLSTDHIDAVSLAVHPGEIVGVAGLLGSGRTELLRALFGIDRIRGGEIRVNGAPVEIDSASAAIDRGIAMVPENRREQGLVLDFPVSQTLVLPIIDRLKRGLVVDEERTEELTARYIDMLKVKTTGPDQIVRFLSGGNQQKIVVAKCLAGESRILLLDDPTFGVDVHAKQEIMRIIDAFAAEGKGVLFVSSEFAEVASFCHSVYIMKKGRAAEFLSGELTEDELLLKVQ